MIDIILIMNEGGLLLFQWSPTETQTTGDLISGFLTAMNMFATGERGEQIKKITLDPTTFFFERESNLIFTILTKDVQFDKIILKIIAEIKRRFLNKYNEILNETLIDVEAYRTFTVEVDGILNDFGYFKYRDIVNSFEEKEPLKSFLLIDKISGDLDYIKSKIYLNREVLGFQSQILLECIKRIATRALKQELALSVIVYPSKRCVFLEDSEKIMQIHEIDYISDSIIPNIQVKERKIEKIKKSPKNLTLKIIEPFVLYDSFGNILISNDKENSLNINEISTDCVTSIASTGKISEIYKESIVTIYFFTESDMYCIFSVSNMIVFLKLTMKFDYYKLLRNAWFKLKNVESLSDIERKEIDENIATVINFKKEFV